ncbi:MAG TPA: peptidoglycan-binding domain-containing protein, partial [Opitutaceae bacterium]|nr:peptidoglycan-binding domain-containing protein [Opitutaceae bacterium]
MIFSLELLHAQEPVPTEEPPVIERDPARPAESILDAQVELHRRGFSCGAIDGVSGAQTAAALRAFQRSVGLKETSALDRATR